MRSKKIYSYSFKYDASLKLFSVFSGFYQLFTQRSVKQWRPHIKKNAFYHFETNYDWLKRG